ncbi:MAG: hypothetical protein RJA81_1794, partial [Planctomycetota bacterium]|jgi:hypothetical protein
MKPDSTMKAGKPRFAGSSVMTTVIFALLILIPCFINYPNQSRAVRNLLLRRMKREGTDHET